MGRKWTVEHSWVCSACQRSNLGRFLGCQNCGKPKGNEKYDERGAEHKPAVTDSKALSESRRGRNWTCSYCMYESRGDESKCGRCGAERNRYVKIMKAALPSVETPAALQALPEPEPEKKFTGGGYRTAPQVEELAPPPSEPERSWTRDDYDAVSGRTLSGSAASWWPRMQIHGKWFAVGSGLVLLVALSVWFFTPWQEHVHVEARSWSRSIELQQRVTLQGQSWDDERPASHFNDRCETRQHGTHDCNPYDCNPHSVDCNCHSVQTGESCSTTCSSGDNGFSECSESCSPTYSTECSTCTEYDTCYHQCPTYDEWCSYNYYNWPTIRTERTAGQGAQAVVWPHLTTDPNPPSPQRLVHHENYSVEFRNENDHWSLTPRNESEYGRYPLHARWLIEVNRAGRVKPLHAEP